jgi:hypothetical protein
MTSNDNVKQTTPIDDVSEIVMFRDGNSSPIMMTRHGNNIHDIVLNEPGTVNPPEQKDHESISGEHDSESDDDLPLLENVDNDGIEEQKTADGKQNVKELKKVHISSGISNIVSHMDKKGNMNISVVYDVECYKCCVCFERIIGPIISCDNGHSLCNDCQTGIAKTGNQICPVCRSSAKERNYLLENALTEFIVKCSNKVCKHMGYPESMKDHEAICKYSEIKCPWCGEKTTPFDLQVHTEFECEKKFSMVSCSNRIDFIKSDEINNIFIQSAMEETRIMYIEKTETECRFICIQGRNIDDQVNSIIMTYEVPVKYMCDTNLTEIHKITIPINKPEQLINGQTLVYTTPLKSFIDQKNMVITGFKEKYMTGDIWMIMDRQGSWYRAKITKRLYYPDRIHVKFDNHSSNNYEEWIELINGDSKKIRPLEANNGRTTQEEIIYTQNMNEDEQLRLVLERSMDET